MSVAFWFRRDLRLDDNTGLSAALQSGEEVVPVFIFDKSILDELPEDDARVSFIHSHLTQMQQQLRDMGSDIIVRYGFPETCWQEILQEFDISAVYTNHDYEPYARKRDGEMRTFFDTKGLTFHTFKDQVIFEKEEIMTQSGGAYSGFYSFFKKLAKYPHPSPSC